MNERTNTISSAAKPGTRFPFFNGKTPTFSRQDHPGSSKKPNTSRLFEGKTPVFSSANTTKKPFSSASLFHGTTPTFLPQGSNTISRPSSNPTQNSRGPPKQHSNPLTQLKLVTLTFTCRHKRFLSQLGTGRLRDHVDVASMLRSVHPTVTPLIAEHYPDAECPSCRRVRVSRGKKVRFVEEGESEDDDGDEGGSEYDTADEGDEEEEGFGGRKVLLKW
ncbi:MAG: hypothetical protein LQ339_002290 [Xanthoria mediterranea]|nr:MAG: hypothetical protein LQ339_002290 [Xanthoria mediterranea]